MKKIMFICTGNICRSAMAHHLLEKIIQKDNLDAQVYSCGIYAENGDSPTYDAIEAMKEYDVDLRKHKATNIKNSEIEQMDLILCMTVSHQASVLMQYPHLTGKVFTLKEYTKQDGSKDIRDPWGFDLETYRFCAVEIEKAIRVLVEKIKE